MLDLLFASVAGAWGPQCGRWEGEMHVKWGEQEQRNSQKWSGTFGCIMLETIRMDWNPRVPCRSSCHPECAQQNWSQESAKLRRTQGGAVAVHSEWAPGNDSVKAAKAPFQPSESKGCCPPVLQITVFNRSLKSFKAAQIYRNGFLQKWKTLCVKFLNWELWENI